MAITPTQLQGVLTIKKEFLLTTGKIKLTDISPYTTNLTLTAPYSIKGLFLLIDPTGETVYINSGYNTDDYTAPDITITNVSSPPYFIQKDIPTATGGDFLFGTYTLYYKVRVIEDVGGSNTTTFAQLNGGAGEQDPLTQCFPATTTESYEANCTYALIKSTDTTNYGTYQSLSRSHNLIPPPPSGQPTQTANAQTITYSAGIPYTGTWSWIINSTVVYATGNNVFITALVEGGGQFMVNCDTNYCILLCIVRKYYNQFFSKFGTSASEQDARNWELVFSNFGMAYFNKVLCGQPDSVIQPYIDTIYTITGTSPDCECGCGGEEPTPIIPTNTINGTDGTNGADGVTPEFRVNGGFIQVSYNSGSTWTNLLSLASITGATGAAGADGADGVAILYNGANNVTNAATTGSFVTLDTYTLPANTLTTAGDEIRVHAVFFLGSQAATGTNLVRVQFGSNSVFTKAIDFFPNIYSIEVNTRIWRVSNTVVNYETEVIYYTIIDSVTSSQSVKYRQTINNFAGLNLTTTAYAVNAQANSGQADNIGSEALEVTFYKKS